MLCRQVPVNEDNYLIVKDRQLNKDLQINGFAPMYYWDKVFYYIKSDELLKFMEERR